jgi:hypothetical protein
MSWSRAKHLIRSIFDTILGVDLGITDIAVTSEGQKFGGKTIKQIKIHYASMRAVLPQKAVKGTRSSRRRCRELLQRLSGKESRYQRLIHQRISTSRRFRHPLQTARQSGLPDPKEPLYLIRRFGHGRYANDNFPGKRVNCDESYLYRYQ